MQSTCLSVLGQDTGPQIAPDAVHSVCECRKCQYTIGLDPNADLGGRAETMIFNKQKGDLYTVQGRDKRTRHTKAGQQTDKYRGEHTDLKTPGRVG